MKSLKLKAVHRLLLNAIIDGVGGKGESLSNLNKMLKLVDKLSLTEAEQKKLKLKMEDGMIKWEAKEDKEVELELPDEEFELVKTLVKKRSEDKEIKLADAKPLLEVAQQLGLEV